MVGAVEDTGNRSGEAPGNSLLRAENVSVAGAVTDVSLDLRAGEISGVFGLVGSGATELPYALFGVVPHSGLVTTNGSAVRTPQEAVHARLAFVPAERREALLPQHPLRRNITLASLPKYMRRGVFRERLERDSALRWIRRLEIVARGSETGMPTLSGGNQQKALVARWLERDFDVLLLSEPTLGVDVRSRAAIHKILIEIRDLRKAVMVASSDLDEVTHIADRVFVFSRQRLVAEVPGGPANRSAVLQAAMG